MCAFIVKKEIHGKGYYYLNENKRVDGKVKTKTLAYLGKTRKDAEKKAREVLQAGKKTEEKKVLVNKVKMKLEEISIEEMATFCKRKGFVYQSGEIYGGFAGFWDFGHLGVELKDNIKKEWWNFHVRQREDIVGIDGSIITHPKVWKASGHVEGFNVNDILVTCKKCNKANKVEKFEQGKIKCECGGEYDWGKAKTIEQMFKINVGVEDIAYLRPETAQLIFTNFKLIYDNARMKLPFGIAQMGKVFRNEVAPRDFLFRLREFEQMEIEYFVDPNEKFPYKIGNTGILVYSEEMQKKNQEPVKMKFKEAHKKGIIKKDWMGYWLEQEFLWFVSLGANPNKFRIRQHINEEKAHYALDTWDLEYKFPFGWKELQGLANRTDFDLKQHQQYSKTNMEVMNSKDKKILPYVICEPSQGVERAFLVFMFDSYFKNQKNETILKLHPKLAPIKAAIFPIVKKPEFEKIAKEVFDELKKEWNVIYDKSGSIGRRYARNDEVGTPFCITIDGESIKKKDVTVRDRDTTKQIRVKISELKNILRKLIGREINFDKAGEKFSGV